MEKTKRHLELAVVKVEGDLVTFRIAEQTHREEEFCPCGDTFISRSGFRLESRSCPQSEKDRLFVRGSDSRKVDTPLTVSVLHFAKIMEAITEYNETDGEGYEKPWPQYGKTYLWVDSTGFIQESDYDNAQRDNERREFGNFFRTREEAEAAIERVKKALKGE